MKHDSDIIKRIKNYFMRRKSASEAYEFEREIEKDAFLYEAIEGFEEMHVSDVQQALDELDVMIDQKAKPSFYQSQSFKVAAAAAVLLLGVSVFGILGLNKSSAPEVVSEDNEAPSQEEALSNSDDKQYSPREGVPTYSIFSDSISNYIFAQTEQGNDTIIEAVEDLPVAVVEEVSEPNELSKDALRNDKPKEDTKDHRQPEEALVMEESEPDTNLDLASAENEEVADHFLDEVVISEKKEELSQKNIQAVPAQNTYSTIGKQAPQATSPSPVNGYGAYQKYIKNNIVKTDEMTSGSVTVTFEFDRKGAPRKIEVSKSVCEACDREAIRVIENGPLWNVDNDNRKTRVSYTVVIP